MNEIGVGILGLGRIAQDAHIPGVRGTTGMRLVAAADATASRRERFAVELGCPIDEDIEALLGRDDVGLVIVATPSRFHHEHVMAALRAGKHVMVEKPMAMSLAEAREMAAEARSRGRVLTVHHNRRFDGDYLAIRRLVENGRLGNLVAVERRFHRGAWIREYAAQDYRPDWRLERAYGGGNLYDWGPHLFDQLLRLVGSRPRSLIAWLRSVRWSREVDDYFKVVLTWDGGTLGQIEASYVSQRPLPHWYVVGSDAALTQESADSPIVLTSAGGSTEQLEPEKRSPERVYHDLVAAIRGEREPEITLDQCLEVMELIEASIVSARSSEVVQLPP